LACHSSERVNGDLLLRGGKGGNEGEGKESRGREREGEEMALYSPL